MKNLLLASTALVASTAFAMADVDVSGSAEMGVFGVDHDDPNQDRDLQFHTDIDVTFTLSGETDGGLTFGASIDLDESDDADAFGNNTQGGETIFVSGVYGTLTMGDTDGAYDFALQEAIIGSAINDDHEHAGYSGNSGLDGTYDGQVARYDYTFGDVSFAVSAEIQDDEVRPAAAGAAPNTFFGVSILPGQTGEGDPVLGAGVKYAGSFAGFDFTAGLGYQTVDAEVNSVDVDAEVIGISLGTTVAGFQVIANYSEADIDVAGIDRDLDHFGIAVGYTFGELLVAANYGEFDGDVAGVDAEGFGLIANYDLGGGAQLQAGYGNNDRDGANTDSETYSFGISMNF